MDGLVNACRAESRKPEKACPTFSIEGNKGLPKIVGLKNDCGGIVLKVYLSLYLGVARPSMNGDSRNDVVVVPYPMDVCCGK